MPPRADFDNLAVWSADKELGVFPLPGAPGLMKRIFAMSILEQPSFFSRLSVRTKINLTVALIFISVVGSDTIYSGLRQKQAILELAEAQDKAPSTLYYDSHNTLMQ